MSSEPRLNTPLRILDAATQCIAANGAAALSMQDIAAAAGVSKALIHYHFHDKDTLLLRLVESATRALVARQRAALADSTPASAMEDLWDWVARELRRGHLRVLVELAHERRPAIRETAERSLRSRREAAAATIERLFTLLELHPRIPAPLLAGVFAAFLDGLAIHAAVEPDDNHRVSFDVFWLSFLSLAE